MRLWEQATPGNKQVCHGTAEADITGILLRFTGTIVHSLWLTVASMSYACQHDVCCIAEQHTLMANVNRSNPTNTANGQHMQVGHLMRTVELLQVTAPRSASLRTMLWAASFARRVRTAM